MTDKFRKHSEETAGAGAPFAAARNDGASARKGASAPSVSVTQGVPLREGAKAPQVVTPVNIPTTSGPVSVTNPQK